MEEITVRFWQPQDLPDLQEIFTAAFGDPPDIAAAFHRVFLTAPEACTLAEARGKYDFVYVVAGWQIHDYGSPALRHYEVVSSVSSRYFYTE